MKNNIYTGLFMGLIFPFAFYFIIQGFFRLLDVMDITNGPLSYGESIRDRTIFLFCICANIIVLQIFQRRAMKEVTRGIAVLTVVLAIAWLINYGSEIF